MKKEKEKKFKRHNIGLFIAVGAAVLFLVGSAVAFFQSRPPKWDSTKLDQLSEQLKDKEAWKNDKEHQKEVMKELRAEFKKMPFEEKKRRAEERMQTPKSMLQDHYAKSPEEQQAELEKWATEGLPRELRGAMRDDNGGGGRGGRGGPGGPGGNNQNGQGDGNNGSNGPQPPQIDPNTGLSWRDIGHRERIEMISPEDRAMFGQFRMQMRQTCQQLGMPMPSGFGGRGGPGRGPGGGPPPGGPPPGGPPPGTVPPG